MEYEIKRIPIAPMAKVMFFVFLVVGFISGLLYAMFLVSIISSFGSLLPMEEDVFTEFANLGLTGIITMGIVSSIFTAVIMTLLTAFTALCYNVFAGWFGGIRFELAAGLTEESVDIDKHDE